MKNLLIPIFAAAGLLTVTAATPDADVATAVQAAFTEKDKAKKEAEEATAALATATTALEAANKKVADLEKQDEETKAAAATAAVTALVDGAVSAGKITAAEKPTYEAHAKADFAGAKAALDAKPVRGSLLTITAHTDTTQLPPLTAAGVMAELQARK